MSEPSTIVSRENLLPLVLDAWELEGNPTGLDKHLQIRLLLQQLPADLPAEQLKSYLAPLLAKDSRQQEEFYRLFDAKVALLADAGEQHRDIVEREQKLARLGAFVRRVFEMRRFFVPIAAAFVLLFAAGFALFTHFVKPSDHYRSKVSLMERQGSLFSLDLGTPVQSVKRLSKTPEFVRVWNESFKGSTLYFNYEPLESGEETIVYEISDVAGQVRKIYLVLSIGLYNPKNNMDETPPSDRKPIAVGANPSANNVEEFVAPNLDTASLLAGSSVTSSKPGNYVEGVSTRWQFGFGTAYFTVWKGLLVLASLVLVLLTGAWLAWSRRKFMLKHAHAKNAPHDWHLSIPRLENVALSENFYSLLKEMRKRSVTETERLDLKKTIRKTAESGGMINFEYQPDSRSREYLALVDMSSPQNHQAKLHDTITCTLQEWEAPIERFYYDGDLRSCWNEKHPHGISLNNLQHKYAHCQLIILGTSECLLDPASGDLAAWSSLFAPWKKRVLLTPKPVSDWGIPETALSQRFRILPATPNGFGELMETLEAIEPINYLFWKEVADKTNDPIVLPDKLSGEALWAILDKEFVTYKNGKRDERRLRWVLACALPPVLFWEWTLYTGEMLSEPGEAFLNTNNLFALNRLPWFVKGNIPDDARRILIKLAEEKCPVWLDNIKYEWQQMLSLKENLPPSGSIAWQNHRIQLLLSELLRHPSGRHRQKLESELNGLLSGRDKSDALAMHYIEKRKNPMQGILPERFRKYVFEKDGIFWKLRHWVWQVPVVLATLLGVLLVHYTEPVTTFEFKEYVTALAFSPDAETVAVASGSGSIGICKTDGSWLRGIETGMDKVISVQFSKDKTRLAAGSTDGYLAVWEAEGKNVLSYQIPDREMVQSITFSADLDTALIGYFSGHVEVWDVRQKKSIQRFRAHRHQINDLAFSPAGNAFLTGSSDGTAKLWSPDSTLLQTFAGHKLEVFAVGFSGSGTAILTGSNDETVKLWNRNGNMLRSIAAHEDCVYDAHFSPDGKFMLTASGGSMENTAKLWTLDGKLSRTFSGHGNYVRNCAFSPDNSSVMTGDANGVVKIWQLKQED